jgi:putative endonuclease
MRGTHRYFIYIMTNRSRTLYVGVTSKLEPRTRQHKDGTYKGFTSRYKLDRLVYFEEYSSIHTALARETELKGWTRLKKIALIVSLNPTWKDLSEEWGKPIKAFKAKSNT